MCFKADDAPGLYNFFFFVTCSPVSPASHGRFISVGSQMFFHQDLSAATR
ncbi:MAG TPA: hypothetical protein PKD73_17195 [Burkholderiaceae bacterium]|jgi:hypothetical protein|nr:hypothetical protein [Burkholderiaceae bacterium]